MWEGVIVVFCDVSFLWNYSSSRDFKLFSCRWKSQLPYFRILEIRFISESGSFRSDVERAKWMIKFRFKFIVLKDQKEKEFLWEIFIFRSIGVLICRLFNFHKRMIYYGKLGLLIVLVITVTFICVGTFRIISLISFYYNKNHLGGVDLI